jgi:hypothetical protein
MLQLYGSGKDLEKGSEKLSWKLRYKIRKNEISCFSGIIKT